MRLRHFLLLTFLLLTFITPSLIHAQDFYKQGYFVVKGQVNNFKKEFIDFGLTTYLGHESGSIRIKPNGSFEQKIPVQNRQSFYLALNKPFILTVSDKDTLYLNWNNVDFKNSFSIKGKNDLRTNELQVELQLCLKFWDSIINLQIDLNENAKKITPKQEFEKINTLYNQHVKTLLASADSFSTTFNYLATGLYFQYFRLLRSQRLLPQFKLKLNLDSAKTHSYFDVSDSSHDYTLLNEDWFWNVPEYRDFIYDYVRLFYKPFYGYRGSSTAVQKPFNPTLDEYYLGLAQKLSKADFLIS